MPWGGRGRGSSAVACTRWTPTLQSRSSTPARRSRISPPDSFRRLARSASSASGSATTLLRCRRSGGPGACRSATSTSSDLDAPDRLRDAEPGPGRRDARLVHRRGRRAGPACGRGCGGRRPRHADGSAREHDALHVRGPQPGPASHALRTRRPRCGRRRGRRFRGAPDSAVCDRRSSSRVAAACAGPPLVCAPELAPRAPACRASLDARPECGHAHVPARLGKGAADRAGGRDLSARGDRAARRGRTVACARARTVLGGEGPAGRRGGRCRRSGGRRRRQPRGARISRAGRRGGAPGLARAARPSPRSRGARGIGGRRAAEGAALPVRAGRCARQQHPRGLGRQGRVRGGVLLPAGAGLEPGLRRARRRDRAAAPLRPGSCRRARRAVRRRRRAPARGALAYRLAAAGARRAAAFRALVGRRSTRRGLGGAATMSTVVRRRLVLHLQKVAGISGSEAHLLSLLPRLRERGWDVRMLMLHEHEPGAWEFADALTARGVPLDEIPLRADVDPIAFVRLAAYLARTRPAILHTHLVHADAYGLLAGTAARVPVRFSTKHGFNEFREGRAFAFGDRTVASLAHVHIAISRGLARYLAQTEGFREESFEIVHYGITPNGEPDPYKDTVPRLLCVGRLIPIKGHIVLLRAFAEAKKEIPSLELDIAGRGPLEPALRALTRELGVAES